MPGSSYRNKYEPADAIKSVVVSYDDAVSQTVAALRFPNAGRVVGAYLYASESSSGTNLIQAGLKNIGVNREGTIVTAPLTNGTVLAGSSYALGVATDGKEAYLGGEMLGLQIVTTMTKTNIDVQIDYIIDALA
jgi:hypothetical protein